MGRAPCCKKEGLNRGPWMPDEDLTLINYIQTHGEGRWRNVSKEAGLLRCGKSCRLRWINYLRPDVKRGHIMPDEEDLILRLHRLLGNRWSLIAGRLPGRTDNDIKNYWNCHLRKKLISEGIDPRTHRPLSESEDIWWIPEDGDSDRQQEILHCSRIPENVDPEERDGSTPSPHYHNFNPTNINEIPPCNHDYPVSVTLDSCISNDVLPLVLVKSGVMDRLNKFEESSTLIRDSDYIIEGDQNSFAHSTAIRSAEITAISYDIGITSRARTPPLPSAPTFVGHCNSSQTGKNQVYPQSLDVSEMVDIEHPSATEVACNELSNTNHVAPNEVTLCSFPCSVPATPMGTAYGDANSYLYSSFLESFMNEDFQLPKPYTTGHNSLPQLFEYQPEHPSLGFELWSTPHSPSVQYHPSC